MGRIRRNQGVTLIELVVTLAVLAVLVAAAAPSFVDFFERYRLRGAADDIVSVISQARTDAVKLDRDVRVSFAGAGTTWCVGANAALDPAGGQPVLGATACDCTVAAQCRVDGERLAIDQGAHDAVTINALPAAFTLSRHFGVLEPIGTRVVSLTAGDYDLEVQVSPLGQSVLCVPSGSKAMAGVSSCP